MQDADHEAEWRTEFDSFGERAVHDTLYHGPGEFDGPKRQFALRWLREQEARRESRERKTFCYVKLTLIAAVAAVLVGILELIETWWFR